MQLYSIIAINNYLRNNVDAIITILENLGMSDITFNERRHDIRCALEPGMNPSSVSVNTEILFYKCFSTNEKGSVVSLVMDRKRLTFRYALEWIGQLLGLPGSTSIDLSNRLPFGGFYRHVIRDKNDAETNIRLIDESVLDCFSTPQPNMLFYKDGISMESQVKFGIGYDADSGRITIPQRDIYGNLIGVMGRMNSNTCDYSERWLPVIPCPRSLTLFGYADNIRSIEQNGGCVIVESEKSVMQLDSMGFEFGLATCTNMISDVQAKILKSNAASINNIIIAFDEGLDETLLREAAHKLQMKNNIYKYRVGYIYDATNDLIPKGSKCSPTDLGRDKFMQILKNKVIWIGGDDA